MILRAFDDLVNNSFLVFTYYVSNWIILLAEFII